MREGWTYKKLGEVCNIRTGKLNANAMVEDGEYPFFTCDSNPYRIDKYAFDTEAILISGNGSLVGHVNYYKGKFNAYQRTYVLDNFSHFHIPYLLTFLKGYLRPYIKRNFKGGCIPYITLPILQSFSIPLPPKSQQEAIVSELDEINSLLALKREQLQKYDKLAQSLFYEMFGDPVENEKGWEVKNITDVCLEISAGGDASKHEIRKTQDEAFSIPVYSNGIEKEGLYGYSNHATISQPAITLAARGTIGAAFIRKNPYIPIIRLVSVMPDLTKIDLVYLYYILKQTKWDNTGGTIPQLPVPKVKLLNLPLPPLPLQQQFAFRIEQIESQKQQVQAAIEKLETLLASRMQYWFE